MEIVWRHFVGFVFNRDHFEDERDSEFCGYLPDGSVEDFKHSFEEVEVKDRDLDSLEVPEGACRFGFYDRLVATTYFCGKQIELRSKKVNVSPNYCYLKYGRLFTRQTPEEDFPRDLALYHNIHNGTVEPFFDEGGDTCYVFQLEDVFVEAGKLKEIKPKWRFLKAEGNE